MENQEQSMLVSGEQPVAELPPPDPVALDSDAVELLSRFLVGVLVLGGDELVARLRDLQQEMVTDPRLAYRDSSTRADSTSDLLRYLSIGLVMRGQRAATRGIRAGVRRSTRSARSALGVVDRLTDNWLARPLRRPIVARVRNAEQTVNQIIKEGKFEQQNSRVLATEGIGAIMDAVFQMLADNPDLDEFVRDLVGQQSMGLATVVVDNTRSVAVTADDVTENLLRRLLRRPLRQDLPPSPVEGEPQTMYQPEIETK
ncbi:MAG: hypothetical protein PVH11_01195 [Anaerolineae bacterium]|jgi:hypothetical protein